MSYRIVWRYTVQREHTAEFEAAYGARGRWAQWFDGRPGYQRTELFLTETERTYITIDYWDSEADYKRFASENREEYATIDASFDGWMVKEEFIGAGVTLDL